MSCWVVSLIILQEEEKDKYLDMYYVFAVSYKYFAVFSPVYFGVHFGVYFFHLLLNTWNKFNTQHFMVFTNHKLLRKLK